MPGDHRDSHLATPELSRPRARASVGNRRWPADGPRCGRRGSPLDEDGRPPLCLEHGHEACPLDSPVRHASSLKQRPVNAHGQVHVFVILRVSWQRDVDRIGVVAGQRRGHSCRGQAVGLQTGRTGAGGVQVKADEQVSLMLLGNQHALRQLDPLVGRPREDDAPTTRFQQGLEALGPIQSELLLELRAERALGANFRTAVSGIKDNDSTAARDGAVHLQQRAQVFFRIEGMDVRHAIGRRGRKSQMEPAPVP